MKKYIFLLTITLFLSVNLSCQGTFEKKPVLIGTWHYVQPDKVERGVTMTVDGKKVVSETEQDKGTHYYMMFDSVDNLKQYKVGYGFRSKYKVSNDTIYSDDEALYKIIRLTADALRIEYIDGEPKRVTYRRTEEDISGLEMIN